MKIRTNYTLNASSFFISCVFQCLECCKCARWGFTAQVVWWFWAFAHL